MALFGSKTLRAFELGTLKRLSATPKANALPFVKAKTNSLLDRPMTTKTEHQAIAETSPASILQEFIKKQQQDQPASKRSGPISGSAHITPGVLEQPPWTMAPAMQIYPENKVVYRLKQDGTPQIQVKDFWI